MGLLKLSALALLCLRAVSAAKDAEATFSETDKLNIKVQTSFPQSEIFGVKVINGHSTPVVLTFTNDEPSPLTIGHIGGSLWTVPSPATGPVAQQIRNLTAVKYGLEIPAGPGAKESVTWAFKTEMMPQDYILNVGAIVERQSDGTMFTVTAFNETVAVVEPDTSIFDPQIIFLYLVLLAAFLGTAYFIYSTWISTLFPQQKSSSRSAGKGGERAKKSSGGSKKVDAANQIPVVGADGPAVASGASVKAAYDESWIPEGHLKKPEAKRVKSTPRSKSKSRKTE